MIVLVAVRGRIDMAMRILETVFLPIYMPDAVPLFVSYLQVHMGRSYEMST